MSIVSEGAQGGSSFERVPPQNIDAEMSVLGGMMLSKDAIADVIEILRATDFYRPAHASVYDVVVELFGRGDPADAVTVGAELKRKGELERIGGLPYLHTLVATVPTAANAAYYAGIVREQAQLRSLVEVGTRIVQLGYTTDGADVEGLVNLAQSEVFAVSEQRNSTNYVTLEQVVPDLYEELERNANRDGGLDGVPTGFAELDAKLNGLRAGQMIIIAARPGGGKSTLAMDICRSCAVHNNKAAAYFSLEMNRTELSMRLLAAESRVFLDRMIKGELESRDWQEIARTLDKISQAPLIVDDSPNMTMGEIRAKSRRMKQQFDIQLIVIDYLQLLTSGGKSVESRQQEVSEFSRSIKLLAKELEIPIVAVAQLNRDSEKRNDKRPQVADLRESGSLEQDADVVLLIHREDMFNENTEKQGMADIIIGKQRSGPTGIVELAFQGHFSRFAEIAD
ncbi:replicative DNA helicase [Peptidiphaga gingivicola]|uniref:Replicative DNA helicase n=1 Tax=Peptidiphaga gingivicola TaxID=2741497 RepID=A0A179B2P1_9ACTO|nr:replicative DNA helicase [Peptidiphaga gingivicola]OAP85952.1 replicative DNA helicase [Peptidiphaga gingivicola]